MKICHTRAVLGLALLPRHVNRHTRTYNRCIGKTFAHLFASDPDPTRRPLTLKGKTTKPRGFYFSQAVVRANESERKDTNQFRRVRPCSSFFA